jgi:serine/threonine protein kinase
LGLVCSLFALVGNRCSGPDGTISHKTSGIEIGQKGFKDGIHEFSIDPRDIEVCVLRRLWRRFIQVDQDILLGRGACGIVSRGIHIPTGTLLAIKAVQVNERGKREQLMNDIQALIKAQSCAYLVQLYAAYYHRQSGRVHVALELMDMGSLQDFLKRTRNSPIPENFIAVIAFQVLKGLEFLHAHKQLHRDIKPGNILLNSDGAVKLSDFGISKSLDNTANICDTFVGTATYMSPERAVGHDYSFSADVWSFGMVLYEMATGQHPFPSTSSFPVLFDCLCTKPEPRLSSSFSPDLCELVQLCLSRDPLNRPSVSQLLGRDYFHRLNDPNLMDSFRYWLHHSRTSSHV